jgi:tricarballylate dehydrogenase
MAHVVVVGGGNAGFSAAQAAAARGRQVVLLEKGRPEEAGGNSFYTAGAFRIAHDGLSDVAELLDPDPRLASTVLPAYPGEVFLEDLREVTGGRADAGLAAALAAESGPALRWLHGLAIGSTGGGKGLIDQHTSAARVAGIEIRYGHRCGDLMVENGRVTGVYWTDADGGAGMTEAESVVLAAGGFEANPQWRREHLGAGWERALVRGTPLNTGDMLRAALAAGAARGGDWSSCHAVAWDAGAAASGDRELTNRLTRQSYPLGIVVNLEGRRFLDEGADFRNYTYAKYGGEILRQPQGMAFQIFDAEIRPMLRAEEYDAPGTTVATASSLSSLASAIGVPEAALVRTVEEFNAGIDGSVAFDPSVKDGRASRTSPPKSNWALPIRTPPFYAFPVTCGITFTFGGLRADEHGRVLTADGSVLPGLYVCGEMLGGLFSGNYPGGTGLTAGTVFGRRAGMLA